MTIKANKWLAFPVIEKEPYAYSCLLPNGWHVIVDMYGFDWKAPNYRQRMTKFAQKHPERALGNRCKTMRQAWASAYFRLKNAKVQKVKYRELSP